MSASSQERRPSWPRRRWRTLLIVGVLVLGGIHQGVTRYLGPRVATVRVARRALAERVVASGRVLPPARVAIGSTLTTTAQKVLVAEGERVKAGQLLVQLEDALERAALARARAGVTQAEAKLRQLRRVGTTVAIEGLRQAEVSLRLAETRHRRMSTLHARGAVSQVELDEAKKALDLARSQQQSAAAQAAATSGVGSEHQFTIAALAAARAAEEAAQARLAQTRLVAPAAGIVLSRAVEPGDIVQPGRVLLSLARDGATQLVFQPEEKALARLRVGQGAVAAADAFPGRPFPARVATIAPAVDAQRGTIEVKLDVPRPPEFLRPDMTVSIDIEVARAEATLTLPAEAVREPLGPRPWLLVVEGGRTARRRVSLGLRGEGTVEIASGVREGEEVVLPAAVGVGAGRRVRAVREEGERGAL